MSEISNSVQAFGTFVSYQDASAGLPSGTVTKGNYWIISVAGTIAGVGTFTKGDILLCIVSGTSSADKFAKIDADLPVPNYILDVVGNAEGAYSLRQLSEFYTGSAIRVRRSSDNAEQDIGFNLDGSFDSASYEAFIGAGTGYAVTWYDQSGNGEDLSQATSGDQPQLLQQDGIYTLRCFGQFLQNSSFIGSLTNSSVQVLWKAPINQQQGLLGFDSGQHADPFWTICQGPFYQNGSYKDAEVEYGDTKFRLTTFKFLNGTYNCFDFGAEANTPTSISNPTFGNLSVGKNSLQAGNGYISEVIVFSADTSAQTLFESYKESYPELNQELPVLYVNVGDSISTTEQTGPGLDWPQTCFPDANIDQWYSIVKGGWKLTDLIAKESRIQWYKDNINHDDSVLIIFAGTNDLYTGSSASDAFDNLKQLAQDCKGMGYAKTLVVTPLPRTATGFETKRQDFSDLVVNDTSGDFDVVLDARTITNIGANGDQTNTTYYTVDEVHLNATGSAVLGLAISTAIQSL